MDIMKFEPHLVPKIWGGSLLSKIKSSDVKSIGESWEVSTLDEGPSRIGDETLSEKIEKYKGLGHFFKSGTDYELNYMIKFLDTSDNLSVQVHPDDEYAKKHENSLGKSECWLILDASEDSRVYLGFKKGVKKKDFEEKLKQSEDIENLMNSIKVKRGDFIFNPSRTIHAIGKNILLMEVQQTCGLTYRVWDWNRVDQEGNSRELHIDKALDVLNFNEDENKLDHFQYQNFDFDIKKSHHKKIITFNGISFYIILVQENSEYLFKLKDNTEGLKSIVTLKGSGQFIFNNGTSKVFQAYESYGSFSSHIEDITFKSNYDESIVVGLVI